MNKKDFETLIVKLIVKYDDGLAFNNVDMTDDTSEIEEGTEYLYAEFTYQIDDRNNDRGSDKDIMKNLRKVLGSKYGVTLDRVDAFPNGYAAYKLTIDS